MTASANDVLRRSVVLPVDLHTAVERVAQADGWSSVQAFVVSELQRLVNRAARFPPEGTCRRENT